MALSNIRNEPQREITESILGVAVVAGVILLDYLLALVFSRITAGIDGGCPVHVGIVLVPIILALIFFGGMGFLYGTHALGEAICNSLADRGLELRPRDRK
jgi:uncharacterized membrane protein YdfJ with MMPL/SSD domain